MGDPVSVRVVRYASGPTALMSVLLESGGHVYGQQCCGRPMRAAKKDLRPPEASDAREWQNHEDWRRRKFSADNIRKAVEER